MSDKIEIDLPQTASQLAKMIETQLKLEAEEASTNLKLLAEYDSSANMKEKLNTMQLIMLAIAFNQPELLKETIVYSGELAVQLLDPASRQMLYIWLSARKSFLKELEKQNNC